MPAQNQSITSEKGPANQGDGAAAGLLCIFVEAANNAELHYEWAAKFREITGNYRRHTSKCHHHIDVVDLATTHVQFPFSFILHGWQFFKRPN